VSVERKRVLVQVLSPGPSVSLCVCRSVCLCGGLWKTVDWICMLFGIISRLGSRMRQVIGIGDCPKGRGNLGGG